MNSLRFLTDMYFLMNPEESSGIEYPLWIWYMLNVKYFCRTTDYKIWLLYIRETSTLFQSSKSISGYLLQWTIFLSIQNNSAWQSHDMAHVLGFSFFNRFLGGSEAEDAFEPWWETMETYTVYGLIMLGKIHNKCQ